MNKNDKKIFELKEKLENKKKALGKKPEFSLKTNCMFTMFGNNYNIHTMNSFELNMMFNWLKQLNNPELKMGDFFVKDYMTDILNTMVKLDYSLQMLNIKKLEQNLDALISAETKTSIEIDKLSELIG